MVEKQDIVVRRLGHLLQLIMKCSIPFRPLIELTIHYSTVFFYPTKKSDGIMKEGANPLRRDKDKEETSPLMLYA